MNPFFPDKPFTTTEIPLDERPREKLLTMGPEVLSNVELIAILLGTGSRQDSVLGLARRMLVMCDGLAGLSKLSPQEITKLHGVGQAKAATIGAALELGKRIQLQTGTKRKIIRCPRDIADLLMPRLRFESKEKFMVVLLSTKNHVLATPTISVGTLNASIVHPRELFREAINNSAASVILVHNHPSGDPQPSQEDVALTAKMVEAGRLLDIAVVDHVIIGDGKYVSLKEQGIM
jgi:DNA repair protein RadC